MLYKGEKNMNEKISVIVAVYNTEKYLKKCIESLLSQSYKNMEIIIVEDCSKDNSKQVLEGYKNNPKINCNILILTSKFSCFIFLYLL